MKAGARFTTHLSFAEREGLRRLAAQNGTTDNYVIRLLLRRALGLTIPRDLNLTLPEHWLQDSPTYRHLTALADE